MESRKHVTGVIGVNSGTVSRRLLYLVLCYSPVLPAYGEVSSHKGCQHTELLGPLLFILLAGTKKSPGLGKAFLLGLGGGVPRLPQCPLFEDLHTAHSLPPLIYVNIDFSQACKKR